MLSQISNTFALERFGRFISKRVFWRAATDQPLIALTFDDGPHVTNTPRLLDILANFDVHATFFLIGRHIEENPEIAEDALRAEHELANHTYSHLPMVRLGNDEIADEIQRTDKLINGLTGQKCRYMRPPMGLFSRRVLDSIEATGYKTVIGDVYPRDPHLPGKERILKRVLARTGKGSIIILHDGGNSEHVDRDQTLWAVEKMIPILLERGLRFVTLSALLSPDVEKAANL